MTYSKYFYELSVQTVHPEEIEQLKYISSKVLNTHAPIKEKHVRRNQSPGSANCNYRGQVKKANSRNFL